MMILYMSILMWGQVVMTGVIEEKSSRVIEVAGLGVPATQLLAGKLLGIGPRASRSSSSGRPSLAALSLAAERDGAASSRCRTCGRPCSSRSCSSTCSAPALTRRSTPRSAPP